MAKKTLKANSTRRPPEPADGHAVVDAWMQGVMPGLQPIVEHVDALIRGAIPGLQYAIKWKRAYYGLPGRGWIIELAPYDVSANVVFLGGAQFDAPPPLGEGGSRYVKLRSVEEADTPEMRKWIRQAAETAGWK